MRNIPMKRVLFLFAGWTVAAWCQQPVISPGGVVNAASYVPGIAGLSRAGYPQTGGGPALADGSVASIFGTNLAASTETAKTLSLPTQLGGTSVSVFGVAAPLFYVSPAQIDFQVPTAAGTSPLAGIVVSTAAGQSNLYPLEPEGVFSAVGIFTTASSGCGQGAVLNVAADGSVSLNSSANSASPGSYISIFGTGLGVVTNPPSDGSPAPLSPLAPSALGGDNTAFDFAASNSLGADSWQGRAPGLVGVDQFNVKIPDNVREGCSVPLQLYFGNLSPPVIISIANVGGPCVDPPAQGYGDVTWEKTITTPAGSAPAVTETDTLTVSLQTSPGRQAPTAPIFIEGGTLPGAYTYFGASCPVPGYRSLAAGTITAQGPGFTPLTALPAPLQATTVFNHMVLPNGNNGFTSVSQLQSGQVSGLTAYQVALPSGTIQPGSFTVAASGGADVGVFQSTVQIGSPIQITTPLAGQVIQSTAQTPEGGPPTGPPPFTINWTGGDPNAWVTLKP